MVGCKDFCDGNYGGVYKLDLMTDSNLFPRRLTDGSLDNVSIVPIPMHWELQDLINEILQAGLNENS